MWELLVNKCIKFGAIMFTAFKSIYGVLVLLGLEVLSLFLPIKGMFTILAGLVIADIITSLIALFIESKKNTKTLREAFALFYVQWTAQKAFDSVPKLLLYGILILVFYHGVGAIVEMPMRAAKLITGIICYVEVRSIIQNGDKAFGSDIWELLTSKVTKTLGSFMELFKIK